MNAIEALIAALKHFTGGVLVVSHDQHFITSLCNELWVVGKKLVKKFDGSFTDYKRSGFKRRFGGFLLLNNRQAGDGCGVTHSSGIG
jgi:ABC-type Mn2+/Zn2+ transport system ATPase subunit